MQKNQKEILARLFKLVKDNTSLDLSAYYTIEDFGKVNNWYTTIDESMNDYLDNRFIYDSEAIDYLMEELGYTGWNEAFEAAENLGMNLRTMDVCELAYAYAHENECEKLGDIMGDIEELQQEYEDIEEK